MRSYTYRPARPACSRVLGSTARRCTSPAASGAALCPRCAEAVAAFRAEAAAQRSARQS